MWIVFYSLGGGHTHTQTHICTYMHTHTHTRTHTGCKMWLVTGGAHKFHIHVGNIIIIYDRRELMSSVKS